MSINRILTNAREHLREKLEPLKRKHFHYVVPDLWISGSHDLKHRTLVNVHPSQYFLKALDQIIETRAVKVQGNHGGGWTRNAIIYNMFVRATCAFDHNQNGKLDVPVNDEGWRETGTFLKALTLLPYVKSLGVNTIHLLPITSIGADGNKGTLGSPYAVKNPYKIDSTLGEPLIGMGVEEEFRLFVHAARHLGMRVVVEFVFRTSSKDSDWIKDHPEWFYWIKETIPDRVPGSHDESQYGNPIFSHGELKIILAAVESGKLVNLLPPHDIYRQMFTEPPTADAVRCENGKYVGIVGGGTRVRIPGAFADWPPDDTQPPWSDVTYLKMYDHPDFNYIAYNTLRMYDERLVRRSHVNEALWEMIAEIIPHYQHEFGIDGVMIDMGHALPKELKLDMIRRARRINPDFAFWDESFTVGEKSIQEGYNAVIGYQWCDQHNSKKFKNLLKRFSTEGFPLPFFATAESHNTPRAAARKGGVTYSRYAWALSNFIPAIPFIHSGFELGETFPINTGLDFTKKELQQFPPERLPLFSQHTYDWLSKSQFVEWIRTISALRRTYHNLIIDASPQSFRWIETDQEEVIAFARVDGRHGLYLLILANSNMNAAIQCSLDIQSKKKRLTDLLTNRSLECHAGMLETSLASGQVGVFEL
ncbi:MAG: alpha-amylase [Ignavibacteria bacterium]|nr:alpha-amylase [Ignavibacteria bacterium]